MGSHPWVGSSISRGMGGQEKKRGVSDFVLYPLVHREFPRAKSGKSFDSASTYQGILLFAWWRVIRFSEDSLCLFSLCKYVYQNKSDTTAEK